LSGTAAIEAEGGEVGSRGPVGSLTKRVRNKLHLASTLVDIVLETGWLGQEISVEAELFTA
jgi:hypothetical protein